MAFLLKNILLSSQRVFFINKNRFILVFFQRRVRVINFLFNDFRKILLKKCFLLHFLSISRLLWISLFENLQKIQSNFRGFVQLLCFFRKRLYIIFMEGLKKFCIWLLGLNELFILPRNGWLFLTRAI